MSAKTYAIHPAIGTARMGNAAVNFKNRGSYYLGPEVPFQVANQGRPYKSQGQIKKQAQRFRIYEYTNGRATREIDLDQPDVTSIVWSVRMVNRKASLKSTDKILSFQPNYSPCSTRNGSVVNRGELVIDSGVQQVGTGQASSKTMSGQITFYLGASPKTKAVELGMIATEPKSGRLLVFGASGTSEGLTAAGTYSNTAPTQGTFDNDRWYDDTSDGLVQATIIFSNNTVVQLNQAEQSARVLVGVPGFAPAIGNFASLYDVAASAWVTNLPAIPNPRFSTDIYPVLANTVRMQWTSLRAALGHADGKTGDFLSLANMALVSDNDKNPQSAAFKRRTAIFNRLRNPGGGGTGDMPLLADSAALTPLQYANFQKWSVGDFIADGEPVFIPLYQLPVSKQPAALDRAGIDTTNGGPFYPGIESWNIIGDKRIYSDRLRVNLQVEPGQLTIGNALPWQTDYAACGTGWWPAQRPNQVWVKSGSGYTPGESWIPGSFDMLTSWANLGFVVKDGNYYVDSEADSSVPRLREAYRDVLAPGSNPGTP